MLRQAAQRPPTSDQPPIGAASPRSVPATQHLILRRSHRQRSHRQRSHRCQAVENRQQPSHRLATVATKAVHPFEQPPIGASQPNSDSAS